MHEQLDTSVRDQRYWEQIQFKVNNLVTQVQRYEFEFFIYI